MLGWYNGAVGWYECVGKGGIGTPGCWNGSDDIAVGALVEYARLYE